MKIHDDHMYHGAALIQVAEHKRFTAINSMRTGGRIRQNAYKVNDEIGIFLKYASKKKKPHKEYLFTFTSAHLRDLKSIHRVTPRLYIALVCVGDREVCCLPYDTLTELVEERSTAKGTKENQYTILVTVPKGKSLRVYVRAPGVKNTMLGKALIIKRNAFPGEIFG